MLVRSRRSPWRVSAGGAIAFLNADDQSAPDHPRIPGPAIAVPRSSITLPRFQRVIGNRRMSAGPDRFGRDGGGEASCRLA